MEKTRKKVPGTIAKIALMFAAFWTMADMFVVSPLLDTIGATYPDAPYIAINWLYCLSQGTVILGTLFVTAMVTRLSKKNMIILGGCIVLVSGGFGGLVPGIPLMLVLRGFEGFGAGICISLIPMLIAELWEDEKTRNQMNSWQAATGCLFGALCSSLTGIIASRSSWRYSYFIYFFSIVCILLLAVGLPKGEPEIKQASGDTKAKMNGQAWELFAFAVIFGILSSCVFAQISFLITEYGIGDVATSGMAGTVNTIGSFAGSMCLPFLFGKLRGRMEGSGCFLMGLGGILLLLSAFIVKSSLLIYVGMFIFGFGNGAIFPYLFCKAGIICEPNSESLTIAWANIGYYVGMFVSSFVVSGLLLISNHASFPIGFEVVGCILYGLLAFALDGKTRAAKSGLYRE